MQVQWKHQQDLLNHKLVLKLYDNQKDLTHKKWFWKRRAKLDEFHHLMSRLLAKLPSYDSLPLTRRDTHMVCRKNRLRNRHPHGWSVHFLKSFQKTSSERIIFLKIKCPNSKSTPHLKAISKWSEQWLRSYAVARVPGSSRVSPTWLPVHSGSWKTTLPTPGSLPCAWESQLSCGLLASVWPVWTSGK